MQTYNDVHHQFAEFFVSSSLKPFIYLVSRNLADGHICLNLNELRIDDEELPDDYRRMIAVGSEVNFNGFGNMLKGEALVGTISYQKQPFIVHLDKFYLQRYFKYETLIIARISAIIRGEGSLLQQRMNDLKNRRSDIEALFPDLKSRGDDPDWQLVASILAVLHNFTLITGGPGTGKTTTIAKLLALLLKTNPDLKIALAAPTGKAAVKMAEALRITAVGLDVASRRGFEALTASTIHRLLKLVPGTHNFRHNAQNPLDYDVVIVDEASMIDVALFAKLLDAVGPSTRVIFLGDKDQLASVEAGNLLKDIAETRSTGNAVRSDTASFINELAGRPGPGGDKWSFPEPGLNHILNEHIIELKQSHRFTQSSEIGRLSTALINNNVPGIKEFFHISRFKDAVISDPDDKAALHSFAKKYQQYILEPDLKSALTAFNKYRVLCAVREGDSGVYTTNRHIENYLRQSRLLSVTGEFYENRPLIITRNYPLLELYNGDTGLIRKDQNGDLKFCFIDAAGNLKLISPGLIPEAETVYAMTIHKSQGSEYEEVFVMLPGQSEARILTRELLYTAITRAKKKVIIQVSEAVFLSAAEKKVRRASGITERLNTEF